MQKYEQRNLELINEMIMSAKKELNDNGILLLMWGWLVFAASLGQFVLLKMNMPDISHYPWMLMPVGGVATLILVRKEVRETKVRTWVDTMMKYIWIAFVVSLTIVLTFMPKLHSSTFPMVLVIYGVGTFITGGALKFRPLVWGGISCWVLAVAAFFVSFEYQLLLTALAVLLSYITPGHILNYTFNRRHVQST